MSKSKWKYSFDRMILQISCLQLEVDSCRSNNKYSKWKRT